MAKAWEDLIHFASITEPANNDTERIDSKKKDNRILNNRSIRK